MVAQREINWDYWLKLTAVEPWEACALSLDIDPDTMFSDRNGYLVGPGALPMYGPQPNDKTIETLVEFNLRLNRLNRYVDDQQFITSSEKGKLALTQFVEWLRATGIDHIPLALAALQPTPEEQARWTDINAWLDENPDIPRRPGLPDEITTPLKPTSNKSAPALWRETARGFGKEECTKHPRWNIEQVAQEVAKRLERDEVFGRGGRTIRWETVKRHALTGIKPSKR